MKLVIIFLFVLSFFILHVKSYQSGSLSQAETWMSKNKVRTNAMLEYLYKSTNTKYQRAKKVSKKNKNLKTNNLSPEKEQERYKYQSYDEIIEKMQTLGKEYPDLIKVETAQKLYNLPHPGGSCNNKLCEHYIAFISNHNMTSSRKPQIFISGEVHGDEQVGPNAAIELISLLVTQYNSNKWIKYLLNTRYIIIMPMSNPYGYFSSNREELLPSENGEQEFRDINRDFPYLKEKTQCMQTVGARVINEIFIHHMIQLALSLHGGTESLTYPYGTPNHIKSNFINKISVNYETLKNKTVIPKFGANAQKEVNLFQQGQFEYFSSPGSKSLNPPDHTSITLIGNRLSNISNYTSGNMNEVVYPVTGGMEDWAYSASWEGAPVITQPCEPKTYGGYDKTKTMYDKYYQNALKSIMFLLEVSHRKTPHSVFLGIRDNNCILNYRLNAYTALEGDSSDNNEKMCNPPGEDGYIPRIMRLSLGLIDILLPYINAVHSIGKDKNSVDIKWVVGGAINIEDTFVIYSNAPILIDDKMTFVDIKKKFEHTQSQKGYGIWNLDHGNEAIFKDQIKYEGNSVNYAIIAKCDTNWGQKLNNADPAINPQTHIANARTNPLYHATNGKFYIDGKDYVISNIEKINFK